MLMRSHRPHQQRQSWSSLIAGAQEGVVQAVMDSARSAQSTLTDLAGSLETGLGRGAQVCSSAVMPVR